MKDFLKSPVALIVGVPVLFLVVVALIGYAPQFLVRPTYDFVYIDHYSYTSRPSADTVSVVDGALIIALDTGEPGTEVRFRRFDTGSWQSMPLTHAEAQALTYDSSMTAPDGYEIARAERASGGVFPFFIFGSSYSNDSVIRKGALSRPLPMTLSPYYYGTTQFIIGWVLE